MIDALEILRFHRGRKGERTLTYLQICWCAATKKNFVGLDDMYKVTPQEVESVNIIQLCSDIQEVLFNPKSRGRFNLTIGSQLTYGSLRIFEYQTISLEEKSENAFTSMTIDYGTSQIDEGKKKKSKKIKVPVDEHPSYPTIEDFPDVDVNDLFGDDKHRKDEHLMEEIDQFLETESHLSFQTTQSSDVEKVMQELYQEMQRNEARSRRGTSQRPETNHTEILRQDSVRTPQRPPPHSVSSSSESARTAVSPPSSQRSGSQLHTSVFEGVPATNFDAPMDESEVLPEDAMPNEPPPSQSSIAVTITGSAAPPLPNINVTSDSVEPADAQSPEENFPMIQEGTEEINVDPNIGQRGLLGKNLRLDIDTQIEMPRSTPNNDVHTKKINVKNQIRKIFKKKVPAQTLLTSPATSCPFGMRKSVMWSKLLTNQFISNLQSNERALRTTPKAAAGHEVAEKASAAEEKEEIEHSPPKIMKTKETTEIQHPASDNDSEMLTETAIPENHEVEPPPARPDPPGEMQTDNVEFDDSSRIEDNIRDDPGVTKRRRKKSSSFTEDNRNEEPKRKQPRVQETDEDAQTKVDTNKAAFYGKLKSLWRSKKMSKGRKSKDGKAKVDFKEIVHPDRCNVTDAIIILIHCFELEKDGKLFIEQKKPYDPLYLVKP